MISFPTHAPQPAKTQASARDLRAPMADEVFTLPQLESAPERAEREARTSGAERQRRPSRRDTQRVEERRRDQEEDRGAGERSDPPPQAEPLLNTTPAEARAVGTSGASPSGSQAGPAEAPGATPDPSAPKAAPPSGAPEAPAGNPTPVEAGAAAVQSEAEGGEERPTLAPKASDDAEPLEVDSEPTHRVKQAKPEARAAQAPEEAGSGAPGREATQQGASAQGPGSAAASGAPTALASGAATALFTQLRGLIDAEGQGGAPGAGDPLAAIEVGALTGAQGPRTGEAAHRVTQATSPQAIASEVANALRQWVDTRRDGETLLRLEHAALGHFSASVRLEGGELLVQLHAQDPALRDLLSEGASSLRDELANAGLVAGGVQVDVGSGGRGERAPSDDAGGDAVEPNRGARRARHARRAHAPQTTGRAAAQPGESRLNLIA